MSVEEAWDFVSAMPTNIQNESRHCRHVDEYLNDTLRSLNLFQFE